MRGTWVCPWLLLATACGGGGGAQPGPVPTAVPSPVETPSAFAYLQDVSPQAAAVCQYAAAADTYRVEWSLASPGSPVLGQASEAQASRNHTLRIGPLSADTRYTYRLRASTGSLVAEGTFTTPPLAGARTVTFAAFGDSGWPGGAEGQVGEAIRAASPAPELVLHAGDVIYPSGERENYPSGLFEPFARVLDHAPIFPTLGNHDVLTQNGAPWLEMFLTRANGPERSPRYYSFDWGDVHFLALDVVSNSFRPGSPQWAFVDADLSATSAAWKVVYFHYPPFSQGPSQGNREIQRYLVPLLESRRVHLVLNGHDHGYQRFRPVAGILYVVSAGGGAPPDPIQPSSDLAAYRSANHFVRVRADARSLLLEALDLQGAVFDTALLSR